MNSELSEQLAKITVAECEEPLVDLAGYEFVLDPQYFNQGLSATQRMLIRESVAEKLKQAKEKLPEGYNFKIWDGYRTLDLQKKLFDDYSQVLKRSHPDWSAEQTYQQAAVFVCPPDVDFTPGHLTGGAIDLTLVNNKAEELVMGTGFDEFVDQAHTYYYDEKQNLSEEEKVYQANRIILRDVLAKEDFAPYPYEWWHFNFGNAAWAVDKEKEMAIYGNAQDFYEA